MVIVKSSQFLEVANRIISESRQLGDLSERDILVLQTGFQKLLRGLTPYTLDEVDTAALKELSDPNAFFSRDA